MKDQIKSMVIPAHHIPNFDKGWGNGYVGVPEGHPWYGKDYDSIDCNVHGGLTYGDYFCPTCEPDGLYWVGFDCAHYQDTAENCPRSYVERETENLKMQAIAAKEAK